MKTPELKFADAIREVTAAMQKTIDDGYRSRMKDADDLVDVLLAIADRLDPSVAEPPVPDTIKQAVVPCPDCGMADADRLLRMAEEFPGADKFIRCDKCGTIFDLHA